MNKSNQPYYMAYERRYEAAYAAGIEFWGHAPHNERLLNALIAWVDENDLRGKRVIEFGCGEGASGVILAELGCVYCGYDVAPSAIEKASERLAPYANAAAEVCDLAHPQNLGAFDAALDVMALHMLVADSDRKQYLENMCNALKPNAPVLFYRECYRDNAYSGAVADFDEWKRIYPDVDYDTPQLRTALHTGSEVEVNVPLLPSRVKTEDDYRTELSAAGFEVLLFTPEAEDDQIYYSATIHAKKEAL